MASSLYVKVLQPVLEDSDDIVVYETQAAIDQEAKDLVSKHLNNSTPYHILSITQDCPARKTYDRYERL